MAAGWKSLSAADVAVGQRLAPLSYEVTATTVILGAFAARDWRPMHHDRDFAIERNGTRDIFMNTPNLAAWFERYLTDWSGPTGRLGRMAFRMRDSIFPGDTMVFEGVVSGVEDDVAGHSWVDVDVRVAVDDRTMTECKARIAIPTRPGQNPWKARGDAWQPEGAR